MTDGNMTGRQDDRQRILAKYMISLCLQHRKGEGQEGGQAREGGEVQERREEEGQKRRERKGQYGGRGGAKEERK